MKRNIYLFDLTAVATGLLAAAFVVLTWEPGVVQNTVEYILVGGVGVVSLFLVRAVAADPRPTEFVWQVCFHGLAEATGTAN